MNYKSKYYANKATCSCGHCHDSRKEAMRCEELHLLQYQNIISDLEVQRRFILIPAIKYDGMPNERSCTYVADFAYKENGKLIVEDTKGYRTKDYVIKRKVFKEKYCQSGDILFRET